MFSTMSNIEWVVREATLDDVGRCAELAVAREGGPPSAWKEQFTALLADDQAALFVAVLDDAVVAYGRAQFLADGVMAAVPAMPTGYFLMGVMVDPNARRMGIGKALCRERLAWAHRSDKDCWFFTNIDNSPSRALHEAVGFTEVAAFRSPRLDGGVGVLGVHSV
jgi:ribosomal protein S18 acetylase RimI-like enzyme